MKKAFGSAVMMRDFRKARGRRRRARLRAVHAKQAARLKRTFLKGTGTSTDIATVMSREFKTIFFYRPDDDLLLTFVASQQA
jgi:hypothetical protein